MPGAWGDGKDGRLFYIHEAGAEERVNMIDWELDCARLETSFVPLQPPGSGSKEVSVSPRRLPGQVVTVNWERVRREASRR